MDLVDVSKNPHLDISDLPDISGLYGYVFDTETETQQIGFLDMEDHTSVVTVTEDQQHTNPTTVSKTPYVNITYELNGCSYNLRAEPSGPAAAAVLAAEAPRQETGGGPVRRRRRHKEPKQKKYQIATPFADQVEEKKRRAAITSKKHRDQNKQEVEELKSNVAFYTELVDELKRQKKEVSARVFALEQLLQNSGGHIPVVVLSEEQCNTFTDL